VDLLQKVKLALRFVGLRTSLRAIRYAIWRDAQNRKIPLKNKSTVSLSPGEIKGLSREGNGYRFHFSNAELEILFLTTDMVRLTWRPGALPPPYALVESNLDAISIDLKQTQSGHILMSPQLEVNVSDDGSLQFYDHNGALLLDEFPPERQGEAWLQRSRLRQEEQIFGLGERAAPLNLRTGTYRLWNTDPGGSYGPGDDPLYLNAPVYVSLHDLGSALVFYENTDDGRVDIRDLMEVKFERGALRYYVIVGSPEGLLNRFTQLTGRPTLPPRWALGYHQCRWGYKTEHDIREVVAGFQEHDLPVSAIHLDIDYMDGYRVFTVDQERFPDLAGLTGDLADLGVRIVTIIDPGVKVDKEYPLYVDGVEKDVFCTTVDKNPLHGLVWPGWCVYPDFSCPATRGWWGAQYKALLAQGVAGFWHDMNEPTAFSAWGDTTLPLNAVHDLEGAKGDHQQTHNVYANLMNRAGYEALRELEPEKRPWILSRSGWAGMQRHAWNWTGDTESTWEALKMTIATVLNLSLSGVLYSGPDIGGFAEHPSAELYTRWFQLAAFLPFFRTHSSVAAPNREPWVYGEPVLTIVREYLSLRYCLIPYLYTLAYDASEKGTPLVRPLFWRDPSEPRLWGVDDAFMLGDALLIAPVLQEAAITRPITVPQGLWYDYWTDEQFQGLAEVEVDSPLSRVPILVSAGVVLPMESDGVLQLHIYPPSSGAGSGKLYSDLGDGYGPSRVDHFDFVRDANGMDVEWKESGAYPFSYEKVELHLHGVSCHQAWVDGVRVECSEKIIRTGIFKQVKIEFSP
jgi:alpha-glucosidase